MPLLPNRSRFQKFYVNCNPDTNYRDSFFKKILMKRVSASILFAAITGLTACTAHSKKILVYASSDIKVDETQKNITVTDGTTFHQKELDFTGSDPVTLNVVSPSGKFTLVATEDGLYIANLKNDTLVGSYQHVGAEGGDAKI